MADGTLVFDTKLDNSGLETGVSKIGSFARSALGTVGGIATTALAAGTAAVTGLTKAVVDGSKETAAYGDNVDKLSQKIGISATAFQEWDYIFSQNGADISILETGMKTLSSAVSDAGNGTASAQEKFERLGLSFEDLGKMSQEDMFSAVIEQLQQMPEGADRTALACDLLGKSAMELGPLLNQSAADTEALKDKAHELGMVMSDEGVKASAAFTDSMDNLQRAFSGAKNSAMGDFLPGLTQITNGLAELVSGNDAAAADITAGFEQISASIQKALPQIVQMFSSLAQSILAVAPDIIKSLGEGLLQAIPQLMPTVTSVITDLCKMLVDMAPQLVQVGLQVIVELALGIAQALPDLIPAAVDAILTIVDTLIDNIDMLVDAAIQIILALANGLIEALPRLIEKAPTIIVKLVDAIIKNAPKLIQAALELMITLGKGIIQAIPQVISKVPEIITGLVNAVKQGVPRMLEVGRNLIEGIGNGIVNATDWLIGKIKTLCNNALGAIKSFFGIASPSKKFKWIGEMCVEGMEEGFEDMDSVADGVTASLNNISANASGGQVGVATNSGFAGALAEILEGMGVYMDGRTVGYITADTVNETMGRFALRRE